MNTALPCSSHPKNEPSPGPSRDQSGITFIMPLCVSTIATHSGSIKLLGHLLIRMGEHLHRIRALFCLSHLWLVLRLALFLFSHGRWTVPICSWFAFVFLIRFHRTSSRRLLAMVTLWVGMSVCYALMFEGFAPIKRLLFYAACFLIGGVWVLPFIVDWLFYRRLEGFAATLLWPSLMVTINYFLAAYLPSLAHSQVEYLSLIQIVSITGIGGLVFLIYWFAATINRIWESEFNWAL